VVRIGIDVRPLLQTQKEGIHALDRLALVA
jgi:hypothetical protein